MPYIKFEYNGIEYSIDEQLAIQLDTLLYNLHKDWDFVIIVSGNRMVRVGKSVLAMTICAYLAWALKKLKLNDNAYGINNIFFDNVVMIGAARRAPKYSVIHYDEGREGLAAIKAMTGMQQDLIDFFSECGQLNHIFVIVAPDFFDLKEDIAVGRSELLINVYRHIAEGDRDMYGEDKKRHVFIYQRGFFQFFNRPRKALLYDIFRTTRRKNYRQSKPNFIGRFNHAYPVDEEAYKKLKADSLMRLDKAKEKDKDVVMRPKMMLSLLENLTPEEIKLIEEKAEVSKGYLAMKKSKVQAMLKEKETIEALKEEIESMKNQQQLKMLELTPKEV